MIMKNCHDGGKCCRELETLSRGAGVGTHTQQCVPCSHNSPLAKVAGVVLLHVGYSQSRHTALTNMNSGNYIQ